VIRAYEGRKIAIVGLSDARSTAEIGVRDPLQTAQAIVPQLRRQADAVILLSHAGLSVDQQIADTVPGLALIVSGGAVSAPMPWRSAKIGTPVWHVDVPSPGHAGRRVGVGTLNLESSGQTLMSGWQGINIDPTLAEEPTMNLWVLKQYGF
jgi:2',3'-cyclic-nucleotide 2'-phosphodiesterase (5'-nucleotidase family)